MTYDIFAITINLHLVKKKPNMWALNFGHFLISFYRAFLHKKVYTCIALVLVIFLGFVYDIVKELNQSVLFCFRRVNFLKLYNFFRVYYLRTKTSLKVCLQCNDFWSLHLDCNAQIIAKHSICQCKQLVYIKNDDNKI